jgi:HAMP domain-containing protein
MARGLSAETLDVTKNQAISDELARFETVLRNLQIGDPVRPLSPPRNGDVQNQLSEVQNAWQGSVRPLVGAYLVGDAAERAAVLDRFDSELDSFVGRINQLVLVMERSYADDTNVLRTMQVTLVLLAIIGTIVLIRFFSLLVIRPVGVLHDGMRRMISNDLAVRLPEGSDDELGGLAQGFNQMAEHLQTVPTAPWRNGSRPKRAAWRSATTNSAFFTPSLLFSANRSSKRRFARALLIKSSPHWGPMPALCGSISQNPKSSHWSRMTVCPTLSCSVSAS